MDTYKNQNKHLQFSTLHCKCGFDHGVNIYSYLHHGFDKIY